MINQNYFTTSFFQRPPGVGTARKGGSAPFWSPGFGASLRSAKSRARFARSTFFCFARYSFPILPPASACCFVALRTTTHSARRSLCTPKSHAEHFAAEGRHWNRFKRRSVLRSRSRLLGRQQMAPLVKSPTNFNARPCGALWCWCAPYQQSLELRRTTGWRRRQEQRPLLE